MLSRLYETHGHMEYHWWGHTSSGFHTMWATWSIICKVMHTHHMWDTWFTWSILVRSCIQWYPDCMKHMVVYDWHGHAPHIQTMWDTWWSMNGKVMHHTSRLCETHGGLWMARSGMIHMVVYDWHGHAPHIQTMWDTWWSMIGKVMHHTSWLCETRHMVVYDWQSHAPHIQTMWDTWSSMIGKVRHETHGGLWLARSCTTHPDYLRHMVVYDWQGHAPHIQTIWDTWWSMVDKVMHHTCYQDCKIRVFHSLWLVRSCTQWWADCVRHMVYHWWGHPDCMRHMFYHHIICNDTTSIPDQSRVIFMHNFTTIHRTINNAFRLCNHIQNHFIRQCDAI